MYAFVKAKKIHPKILFWRNRGSVYVTFDALGGPTKRLVEKRRIVNGSVCCRVVSYGSTNVVLSVSDDPKDVNWFSMKRQKGVRLNVRRPWA